MMEAVRTAADPYGDKVKYIEHKIKDKESVVCMMKLGVQNIPTICIDGDVKYVSIIPDYQELSDVIGEYVSRKEK